jgi:hypothetical protein
MLLGIKRRAEREPWPATLAPRPRAEEVQR